MKFQKNITVADKAVMDYNGSIKRGSFAMNYEQQYIDYLVQFHADRDYFECHEIMEEHWKANPSSPYRKAWLGLIQVAVSLYHQRRGNQRGALLMMDSALTNLDGAPLEKLGLEPGKLMRLLEDRRRQLKLGSGPYSDMNLPLQDERLLQACLQRCEERGVRWMKTSNPADHFLTNKHTLRDRSGVIQERSRRLERKRLAREQLAAGQQAGRSGETARNQAQA